MIVEKKQSFEFFREFRRKFVNYAKAAPLYVELEMTAYDVLVKHTITGELHRFKLDTLLPVEENVRLVKTWLFDNWYPYLEEEVVTETSPSTEEVLKRSRLGESVEDLLLEKSVNREIVRWTIERISSSNQLVLTNGKTPWLQAIYQLHIPSINFITRLLKKEVTPRDGWEELQESFVATFCYNHDRRNQENVK